MLHACFLYFSFYIQSDHGYLQRHFGHSDLNKKQNVYLMLVLGILCITPSNSLQNFFRVLQCSLSCLPIWGVYALMTFDISFSYTSFTLLSLILQAAPSHYWRYLNPSQYKPRFSPIFLWLLLFAYFLLILLNVMYFH